MRLRTSIRANLNHVNLDRSCTKAEHAVSIQAERDSRRYMPSKTGKLRSSGKVYGNTIVWNAPYAAAMYFGNVMVDKKRRIAGFETPNGWRSFKGSQKIHSDRKYSYRIGGEQWFTRVKRANLKRWLLIAQREINNG